MDTPEGDGIARHLLGSSPGYKERPTMELNAFGQNGRIVKDPRYTLQLIRPKKGTLFGAFWIEGSEEGLRSMLSWLCHNQYGVTLERTKKWAKKNKPAMEVTDLEAGLVHIFTWLNGYQGAQMQMGFMRGGPSAEDQVHQEEVQRSVPGEDSPGA
jgi:hypothetical protein